MSDRRLVIIFLGAIALVSLGSITYLSASRLPTPDVLVAGFSGALGSLGTLLTVRRQARRRRGYDAAATAARSASSGSRT